MKQSLLINCYPIRVKEAQVTIYYSESESESLRKASKTRLTLQKEDRGTFIYWSPIDMEHTVPSEINISDHRSLFRDYLNEKLYSYFKNMGFVHKRSFLGGTEVWLPEGPTPDSGVYVYKVFNIRILSPKDQCATDTGWTLLVSYGGERKTVKKEVPRDLIKTFISSKEVLKLTKFKDSILPDNIEVVLNLKIAQALDIPWHYYKEANKYKTNFSRISIFYDQHLKGKQIGDIIHILEAGMAEVLESRVRRASVETNVLEFKSKNTNFNAYIGLREYGPLASPNVDSYKFFFIFHEGSRDQANKLYQYLNRGFKGYPGLKSFVDVNLSLDTDKTIKFSNFDRPSDEIISSLRETNFAENETYFAIYLSPINRDEMDESKLADYYLVKNELLSKNIASQVIFHENIENPNFNFFLPNISIAILAKLGGRPWRLSREVKDELIIGVGAYRQDDSRYLGTTFSFRNDGTFLGFDATECPDIQELGIFFKQTISSFVSEVSEIKRVIVHFFKKMNFDEEKQLTDVFSDLGLQVPYFVLKITEGNAHEYLIIDDQYAGKMPRSGICVKLKTGEFLLCNNTRYKERTGARIDEFPFPLKISVSKPDPRTITDEIIHELIDQIYQFSRMYWRSVKQRAMPVTILYSEMIAKMAANLPDQAVPNTNIAKRTLWFL